MREQDETLHKDRCMFALPLMSQDSQSLKQTSNDCHILVEVSISNKFITSAFLTGW